MRYLLAFTLAWLSMASVSIGQVFFEDFEDSTIGYTTTPADDLTEIAGEDYFGRIAPDTALAPADIELFNLQDSGYFGVHDSDGTPTGSPADFIDLEIFGLNITDYENLNLSFFVAEDDDGTSQDWDSNTTFLVEYQIDGGGFQNLFAVRSENATVANRDTDPTDDRTNERPLVDTDFNGVGDGLEITSTFTQFAFPLGTGSTLDLRFNFDNLDAGDEDFALDSILVTGDFVGVPEPGTFSLLLVAGATSLIRRRR